MKTIRLAAVATVATSLTLASAPAHASCDAGEIVIKFAHVTNTDKHPKGIAATLLEKRVNAEMVKCKLVVILGDYGSEHER